MENLFLMMAPLFSSKLLLVLFFGTLFGLILGVLPGLGPTTGGALILSFTIVFVLKNILLVFINFWQIRFGNELRLRLSNEFFENYLNQNTSFFTQRDKAVISRYVISETNNVREIIINLGNI